MRLSCVILTKMDQAIRPSNPFAKQLEERIQRAKPNLPECPIDNLLSSVASSQESSESDTDELKKFLETKIREHLKTISGFWNRTENPLYPYYTELRDVYDTVISIANSELLEFDRAKDLIAQKLVTIQNQQGPFEQANTDEGSHNGVGSSPDSGVHLGELEDYIEQQQIMGDKGRQTRYANQCGDLSEIHEEEPNGILSTTNAGGGSQDFEYTQISDQPSET